MELPEWSFPWCEDWFPGDDNAMFDWDYGSGDVIGEYDPFSSIEREMKPRQDPPIFRPFLSLTAVESVVPAMNALINKRTHI